MKNIPILPLLILLGLFVVPAACNQEPKDPTARLEYWRAKRDESQAKVAELEKELGAGNGAQQRVRTVSLMSVEIDTFRHFIDLQGRVEAENNVPVTAKMPGVLTQVYVRNGDNVRKGQVLAQLDADIMRSGLTELEIQLKSAQDVYNRQKALWDQKIGTEMQFIQARTQVEALQQRIATTREQMGQSRIVAPIGGTVDMVMLKPGQAISPGLPLCNIVNLGQLKITGGVPEAYVAKVSAGDPVIVHFPDLKKDVQSRVRYVSKSIDPTSRTFTVETTLPGSPEYRANMVAVLKITDYQNLKAVTVPVNVIQTGDEGDFVLVVDKAGENQGTVRRVPVKQGQNYNGMVEITEGLKPGDQIIATGFQDVNVGETVAF